MAEVTFGCFIISEYHQKKPVGKPDFLIVLHKLGFRYSTNNKLVNQSMHKGPCEKAEKATQKIKCNKENDLGSS